MNRKWDWDKIEREYISGEMSLRSLAVTHNINNHSLIMTQAKKKEWVRKREEYQDRASNKARNLMADEAGKRIAQESRVRDNAIEAIDEAITKMRTDMKKTVKRMKDGVWTEEPLVVIRPQDLALLIDRLQVLFGKPSHISEERSLGINLTGEGDPDFLRVLVEASRGRGSDPGGVVNPSLPRIIEPRKN